MNHVVLIGRLVGDPEVVETENDTSRLAITLAVARNYKNTNGVYETDFIRCVLWNGIAKNVTEYCKKGDMICVRGRLQVRNYEADGIKKYTTEVIIDTVSFLQKKHEDISCQSES